MIYRLKISVYHIDAFIGKNSRGNPADVCPLKKWLPDKLMQEITEENNLSETAFFVRKKDYFQLRWFTPKVEVNLCGHATLASADVIFNHLGYKAKQIKFMSKSGELTVTKNKNLLTLNFPAWKVNSMSADEMLVKGLGAEPKEVYVSRDVLAVFENEKEILNLKPDFNLLAKLECLGVIVTAKGDSADFVSRFFAPKAGINEDPVTGSAHSTLIPFWAERLKKKNLYARQLSEQGGELFCEYLGERVLIGGRAKTFMKGEILL